MWLGHNNNRVAKKAIKANHVIRHPNSFPVEHRHPASANTINKIVHFAEAAGWPFLGEAIAAAKFTVEQKSLA